VFRTTQLLSFVHCPVLKKNTIKKKAVGRPPTQFGASERELLGISGPENHSFNNEWVVK